MRALTGGPVLSAAPGPPPLHSLTGYQYHSTSPVRLYESVVRVHVHVIMCMPGACSVALSAPLIDRLRALLRMLHARA